MSRTTITLTELLVIEEGLNRRDAEIARLRECVRVRDEWIASMNGCWADCPHSALEADSCPTITHTVEAE